MNDLDKKISAFTKLGNYLRKDKIDSRLNDLSVVPISEYETALSMGGDWNVDDVLLVWFVPRSLKKKKTARGAEYWILEVIDENNIMTSIK